MAALFQLSDRQWAAIEPLLPTNQPGARRVDDPRVISGIIQVLKNGFRWPETPPAYGPSTTIYNRFHRWSQRGIWQALFAGLVEVTAGGIHRPGPCSGPKPQAERHLCLLCNDV